MARALRLHSEQSRTWSKNSQPGALTLLLDGLDEVLGGDTAEAASAAYNRVAREIDRLATRFPNAPIAVTCRRAGWRGKLPAFAHTRGAGF